MRSVLTVLSVAAIVALTVSVARATPPSYAYVDIGGVPGEQINTQADGGLDGYVINNLGQIVGHSTTYDQQPGFPPLPDVHPFLWTPGNGMTFLPNGTNGGAYDAYAVNNSGQVVGSAYGGTAFYWTNSGGMTLVNNTEDGYAINDSGLMVGDGGPNGDAFAYNTATSTLYDCGPDTSGLFGVSSSGLAVGVSYASRVFLWSAAGGGGHHSGPGLCQQHQFQRDLCRSKRRRQRRGTGRRVPSRRRRGL